MLHRSAGFQTRHAKMLGRLLDLGSYPGMIETGSSEDWVVGEIVRPRVVSEKIIAALDAYEGVAPDGRNGEYKRVVRNAIEGGCNVCCWVYLLRHVPADAPVIESGDWTIRR